MTQKRVGSGRVRKKVIFPDDREDEDLFAAVSSAGSDGDLLDADPENWRKSVLDDKNSQREVAEEKMDAAPGRKTEGSDLLENAGAGLPDDEDGTDSIPDDKIITETATDSVEYDKPKKLSGEWIDGQFNRFVDRAVIHVPAFFRLTGIRIARRHLGWHIWLILVSIRNAVSHILGHFRSEDDMDLFLDDAAEHLGDRFSALKMLMNRQMEWLVAIDMAGGHLRFILMLFITALSACGSAVIGTWEIASLSVMFVISWLSTAFDLAYKPVIGRIRQVYIAARLLSALSMLIPAMMYYIHYRDRGVANNMMLQGMLIFMLLTHLVLFIVMIIPNRQQSLFLRVLSGILGIIPALMVANVVSYSATIMGMGLNGFVGGAMRILGVLLLFLGDRIESLRSLGSLRFMYSEFFLFIGDVTGCILLLTSAWVFNI